MSKPIYIIKDTHLVPGSFHVCLNSIIGMINLQLHIGKVHLQLTNNTLQLYILKYVNYIQKNETERHYSGLRIPSFGMQCPTITNERIRQNFCTLASQIFNPQMKKQMKNIVLLTKTGTLNKFIKLNQISQELCFREKYARGKA